MGVQPLISIGMPVYNGAAYLEEALTCFLAQTVDDFELIVSDDASSDASPEIAQDYASKDARIRFEPAGERLGGSRNFNRTFALATGRFFRWAAHDDLCAPTYLERCLAELERDPDVVMAHSAAAYIDANGQAIRTLRKGYVDASNGYVERDLPDDRFAELAGSIHPHERLRAALFHYSLKTLPIFGLTRSAALERTMLNRSLYGTDKIILAELALQGRIVQIPDVLFFRRTHSGASTRLGGAKKKASWADPTRTGGFLPLAMFVEYSSVVRDANLPRRDKARCAAVVAHKLLGPETWAKMFLPSQRNYLGWS
jgi:glycosyltransferase involved in cell wall biosynthesis